MAQAFIAFGGNLGDVLGAFSMARSALGLRCGRIVKSSALYRTRPLLAQDAYDSVAPQATASARPQPAYLNAVCWLETQLAPETLLAELHHLEYAAGRRRSVRWAARELDLDLLAYDGLLCATASLVLPHPHLRERAFVLRPLVDVAPHLALPPDGLTPKMLLERHAGPNEGIEIQAKLW